MNDKKLVDCPKCDGTGTVEICLRNVSDICPVECEFCDGTGKVEE